MKNCVKCNAEIEDKAMFCVQCGTKQPQKGEKCVVCETELPTGARFCSACGTRQELTEPEIWADCNYRPTEGRGGFENTNGKVVIEAIYDFVYGFKEGFARVKLNHKKGFVKPDGTYLIEPLFSDAEDFSGGLALVELYYKKCIFGKYGYIGTDGRFAIAPKFDGGSSFSEGVAAVKVGEKFGYIKSDGTFLVKPIFVQAGKFSKGKASVKIKGRKWNDPIKEGVLFADGSLVVDGKKVDAGRYHHVSLTARKDRWGRIGFADVEHYDKWVIQPQFEYVGLFGEDNLAVVKKGGKYGFVRTNGSFLTPVDYDDVGEFSEGLARVRIGERYGFIKTDGSYLVKLILADADLCFENGRVSVTVAGERKPKILCHDGRIIDSDRK